MLDTDSINKIIAAYTINRQYTEDTPEITEKSKWFSKYANIDESEVNRKGFMESKSANIEGIACTSYKSGYIVYSPITSQKFAISFGFSGCAMARMRFNDNCEYVFHIYLAGIDTPHDTRRYWNNFIVNTIDAGIVVQCVLFKPAAIFHDQLLPEEFSSFAGYRNNIIGVIDDEYCCHSIRVTEQEEPQFIDCHKNIPTYKSYSFVNCSLAEQ